MATLEGKARVAIESGTQGGPGFSAMDTATTSGSMQQTVPSLQAAPVTPVSSPSQGKHTH